MGNILLRIGKIATNEKLTIGGFERKIGASKGVLSRAMTNGTDIQSKWIQKIIENYPLYSAEWLLTGKGDMLRKEDHSIPVSEENKIPYANHSINRKDGIPLIPESAMAGALSGEITVFDYECERYVIPMFKGADFLISVKGTSMYPKYSPGDIVACKRVALSDLFFQWGKVYVLDTCQGAIIKRINPGTAEDKIKIVSENKKYSPFELSISDIHSVALVIGVVRLE